MALDVPTGLVRQVAPAGALGAQRARCLPIAEHGLIGDLHTSALVGTDGTIDWYCCPRFDSVSVFAAILDADRGGRFRIAPEGGGWTSKQFSLPDWAFVQHYDSDVLDASLLLMPLCKCIAPTDPRSISTLDAITAELVSDSLVYRYNVDASPDGLAGEEATFSLCSFWWVEALARAGRLDEARLALEKMLTYANHVGLYSEEIGPTGGQLGNFSQAFTHLALISASYNLDRQLG
jgi:GH15 family glucan-1,4-alpha-glucosidase